MAIAPNDARVLLLFGDYRGTVRTSGFYWVNPFFTQEADHPAHPQLRDRLDSTRRR